MKMRKSTIYWL